MEGHKYRERSKKLARISQGTQGDIRVLSWKPREWMFQISNHQHIQIFPRNLVR